jgi:hypothetical protein
MRIVSRTGDRRSLRTSVLATTVGLVAGLAFTAGPALAAGPPEAPTTEAAENVTATTATFKGLLNPATEAPTPGYQFTYGTGGTCEGAGSEPVAEEPLVSGMALPVTAAVTGLEPGRKYKVCLVASNGEGASPGNELPFTTAAAPPSVEGETASGVRATEATLEATVNPENEETTYTFEYAASEAELGTPSATKIAGAAPTAAAYGGQGVSVSTGPALTQNTSYFFRVVAENAQSKLEHAAVDGAPTPLKSALPPETPTALTASEVTGTTATLRGTLNPGAAGNPGNYEFFYRQSATECQGGTPEEDHVTGAEGAAGEKSEEAKTPIAGLLPKHQYSYCLLARNEAGETKLGPVSTFESGVVLPTQVETGEPEDVTPTGATLTGTLVPGGEAATYFEYGTEPCGEKTCGTASSATAPVHGEVEAPAVPGVLTGLKSNTFYHYWLVAKNAAGEAVHGVSHLLVTAKSASEEAEEAVDAKRPAEETAAVEAANNKLHEELKHQEEATAAEAAAKNKQYSEITSITAGLFTSAAQGAATPEATEPASTPKAPKCKKNQVRKGTKCVKKRKKKTRTSKKKAGK